MNCPKDDRIPFSDGNILLLKEKNNFLIPDARKSHILRFLSKLLIFPQHVDIVSSNSAKRIYPQIKINLFNKDIYLKLMPCVMKTESVFKENYHLIWLTIFLPLPVQPHMNLKLFCLYLGFPLFQQLHTLLYITHWRWSQDTIHYKNPADRTKILQQYWI